MSHRQRRTSEHWKDLFASFEKSGLTQDQFCAVEGLSLASFAVWRRKLRANATTLVQTSEPTGFVEICLPKAPPAVTADNDAQPDLIVELPLGVVLKFRGLAAR